MGLCTVGNTKMKPGIAENANLSHMWNFQMLYMSTIPKLLILPQKRRKSHIFFILGFCTLGNKKALNCSEMNISHAGKIFESFLSKK